MNDTTEDESYVHKESYLWGLEIGLGTALGCKSREEIQRTHDLVKANRERKPGPGEVEYQSWIAEMEMQSWNCKEQPS